MPQLIDNRLQFSFPVWVVTDPMVEANEGTVVPYIVADDKGAIDLPVFTGKETANLYMSNKPVHLADAVAVESNEELKDILEAARKRGCSFVRVDDPGLGGGVFFCPPIDDVIAELTQFKKP